MEKKNAKIKVAEIDTRTPCAPAVGRWNDSDSHIRFAILSIKSCKYKFTNINIISFSRKQCRFLGVSLLAGKPAETHPARTRSKCIVYVLCVFAERQDDKFRFMIIAGGRRRDGVDKDLWNGVALHPYSPPPRLPPARQNSRRRKKN